MPLTRRTFLALTAAATTSRLIAPAARAPARRILTLAYDKAAGAMRATERLVP